MPPVTSRLRAHTSAPPVPHLFTPSPVIAAVVALSSLPAAAHDVAPGPEVVPAPHAVHPAALVVFE